MFLFPVELTDPFSPREQFAANSKNKQQMAWREFFSFNGFFPNKNL